MLRRRKLVAGHRESLVHRIQLPDRALLRWLALEFNRLRRFDFRCAAEQARKEARLLRRLRGRFERGSLVQHLGERLVERLVDRGVHRQGFVHRQHFVQRRHIHRRRLVGLQRRQLAHVHRLSRADVGDRRLGLYVRVPDVVLHEGRDLVFIGVRDLILLIVLRLCRKQALQQAGTLRTRRHVLAACPEELEVLLGLLNWGVDWNLGQHFNRRGFIRRRYIERRVRQLRLFYSFRLYFVNGLVVRFVFGLGTGEKPLDALRCPAPERGTGLLGLSRPPRTKGPGSRSLIGRLHRSRIPGVAIGVRHGIIGWYRFAGAFALVLVLAGQRGLEWLQLAGRWRRLVFIGTTAFATVNKRGGASGRSAEMQIAPG